MKIKLKKLLGENVIVDYGDEYSDVEVELTKEQVIKIWEILKIE